MQAASISPLQSSPPFVGLIIVTVAGGGGGGGSGAGGVSHCVAMLNPKRWIVDYELTLFFSGTCLLLSLRWGDDEDYVDDEAVVLVRQSFIFV